jgi:putative lysine transport system substrate-binding protein
MPTAQAALVAYPAMEILDFSGSSDDFQVSQEEINIGISVSKKNPELTKAINGVLATLTVDDFNRMMDEAIAVQPLSK